jgi:putative photosynthetic complex assembly protein 2
MPDALLAVVFAVFIWWFSTGVVLILNRLSTSAVRISQVASSALALAALAGLAHAARQPSVAGAYCAFTCALLVWGWNELSFLSGWITGPRRTPLPPRTAGWARFVASFQAVQWHELGILCTGIVVVGVTWDAPNQVGTATYLVLWVMRTSAKLNLFFGVRNLNEAFLPDHLAYLASFFRRRAMNPLLPISVLAASAYLALLISYATSAYATSAGTSATYAVGHALVGTMLALAILEHLLLVLPLDPSAAWRWAIAKRSPATQPHTPGKQPTTGNKDATAFSVARTTPSAGAALDSHGKLLQIP